ncbi:MAG: iron ABC transporter permease [Bacteroidaceae bacterium]|nr:iron ABC transporter permease [Bacteroidaceae bacterium]
MKNFRSRKFLMLALPSVALLLFFAANILFGSVDIPAGEVVKAIAGDESVNATWRLIVMQSRLPQAVVALFCGMALSAAGLMLQTLFNNPLAGPEVFGINSGAGLGVAVVMLLLQGSFSAGDMNVGGYLAVLAGAFIGALAIIGVILFLSLMLRGNIFLLIAGMALSYLTSSVISLLNYFSTAEGVHSYLIWGMGNFGGVSGEQLPLFVMLSTLALFASLLMMKPLNALLLGNAYAENLGVNTTFVRAMLLLLTGLLTAVVTAYCGPISFIGLAVPHVARLLLRTNNHRLLLPVTLLIGACTALLCNLLCQLPGDGGLIPLSAVTPLLGAPVILYVVLRNRGNFS